LCFPVVYVNASGSQVLHLIFTIYEYFSLNVNFISERRNYVG